MKLTENKIMTEKEFNEWLTGNADLFETPNGEPVITLEDLSRALYDSKAITEETADKFRKGEYLTDPVNVALSLDCYMEAVNRIQDLAFEIEAAMNTKTIFTEDFTKYAVREIQTICERMSID